MNANEAGQIAARRAVQPFRARGREHGERGMLDQAAVVRRDAVRDLDRGCFAGKALDCLELCDGRNDRHCRFYPSPVTPAASGFSDDCQEISTKSFLAVADGNRSD
jgi:hypothetical protein